MHRIQQHLLTGPVQVFVVGCGGTGSAVASALPYLHQAMVANGHPGGLQVTLVDGDTISATNCVRQPFSVQEIGLKKAVVLAHRINTFWGFKWIAVPENLKPVDDGIPYGSVVIGCVDTRAARRAIAGFCVANRSGYWLDIGNTASGGQFVLGEPHRTHNPKKGAGAPWALKLQTVDKLYPEVVDPSLDDANEPSCSAVEALDRQEPFVNQVLANHALALLARLFRHGAISYQGGFVNLETGKCAPIVVPSEVASKRKGRKAA